MFPVRLGRGGCEPLCAACEYLRLAPSIGLDLEVADGTAGRLFESPPGPSNAPPLHLWYDSPNLRRVIREQIVRNRSRRSWRPYPSPLWSALRLSPVPSPTPSPSFVDQPLSAAEQQLIDIALRRSVRTRCGIVDEEAEAEEAADVERLLSEHVGGQPPGTGDDVTGSRARPKRNRRVRARRSTKARK